MVVGPASEDEVVRPVDLGIRWDMGAPLPHLLQAEGRAFLAFYLPDSEPGWDGTMVQVVDPASPASASIGIVTWSPCRVAVLGPPNDEAITGHRLWERGLRDIEPYSAAEVLNSAWIASHERANRVHRRHNPQRYASLRHYVLLFHDSTFECLVEGYTVQTVFDAMPNVLARLARQLVE